MDGYRPAKAYDSYKSYIKGWCSDMTMDKDDELEDYEYNSDSNNDNSRHCLNSKKLNLLDWCKIL